MVVLLSFSCNKNIAVKLPGYDSELAVEMYLEDNTTLKCLLTESLPYSSDTISKKVAHAKIIFSDGTETDTLYTAEIYEYESGRLYNYGCRKKFRGEDTKTYSLKIVDSAGRTVTATTKVPPEAVKIDSLIYSRPDASGRYSATFSFKDPSNTENYYRAIIGKGINNYKASSTDKIFSDATFSGQRFSVTSETAYQKGDTITVRLYTLLKEHYDYLQSFDNARVSTYNPFVQPASVKTNIKGGQGIFTAIRYVDRQIVIK